LYIAFNGLNERSESNMNNIYEKFNLLLVEENKEEATKFILELLQNKEIDILELYMDILTPSLNLMQCMEDKRLCIWKEHVRTAIIRTIVECCFPYVLKKRDELNYSKKGTAIVLCPPEEYHDLGARMVTDFFTISGYHAIYVGSNTPYSDFRNAIDIIKPNIVAISVSNYYNMVVTKKVIKEIKEVVGYPIKIVVGGNAFNNDTEKYKIVGADYYAKTYEDIKNIAGDEVAL
jgi:methanogenic corrinoid protein MtbC1